LLLLLIVIVSGAPIFGVVVVVGVLVGVGRGERGRHEGLEHGAAEFVGDQPATAAHQKHNQNNAKTLNSRL
jgi:hypothetical protein